ncbi:MAG: hypothetical protein KDA25_11860, partial [Phycisphaerales bacterium]|nr:hypothetical protein [Phycisphaerales bacterium]
DEGPVGGGTGLAARPSSGVLYVVLKLTGVPGGSGPRWLATVDPLTGNATMIGNLGDSFAGIAFTCDDTLYGVTGDGAAEPETLYEINPATAETTLVMALGAGTDGEMIGYDPVNNVLWHGSGHSGDDDVVLEHIDVCAGTVTPVDIAGTDLTIEETQAITWWPEANVFLWKQDHGTGPLYSVTHDLTITYIGDTDHQAKGLAFVNGALATCADQCGASCVGDFDGDGSVGPADLAALLADWGACPGCATDLTGDGQVGPGDLAILLANWGSCGG